jgi:flagellar biosynthetic protein FliQ
MNPAFIQGLAFDVFKVILLVSGPALAISLIVGLAVSILQATTQVNEMTLAYIPKIIAIYCTLIVFAGYIMDRLMAFTTSILSDFTRFIQ